MLDPNDIPLADVPMRQILEASPTATLITRFDGSVVYANQRFADLYGQNVAHLVGGIQIPDLYGDPAERQIVLEKIRQQGHLDDYEMRAKKADGSPVWVLLSVRSLKLGEETLLLSSLIDISERKKVEEALRKEREFLRKVIDAIPGFVAVKDQDGRWLLVNKSLADVYNTTPAHLVGKGDADFSTNEEELIQIRQDDQEVITTRQAKLIPEEKMTSPNGQVRWLTTAKYPLIDDDGHCAQLLAVTQDITERKKAEEALRESEARYSAVVNQAKDGVIIIQDNLCRFVNQAMADILGYEPGEIDNTPFINYIAPESRALIVNRVKARLAGENDPSVYEARLLRQDGTIIDAELSVGVIQYFGKPADVGLIRDITERKRLERQIRESLERRGRQMRLSTQVAQAIATATSLEDLHERVVTQVKEQFGYYHTQLLNYEPSANAVVLATGYGEIGATMLAAGHRLPMGVGLIVTAATTGQTVLRPTLSDDPDWRPNSLLPDTQGEIAVPIKLGDRVLGVLDVQSAEAGLLGPDDQLLLEGLCGQIAIAIEDTRLRQEMQERLAELNMLYRAASHEGWQAAREADLLPTGYRFDQTTVSPLDDSWTVAMSSGVAQHPLTVTPLTVRGGEVIGSLGVVNDPQRPLSDDELALVEQVSEQVTLALESARLFAQTQLALAETQSLYNITSRLNAAKDLQEIVSVAVEEIHIPDINCGVLIVFERDPEGDIQSVVVRANWHNGQGNSPTPVGTRYPEGTPSDILSYLLQPDPIFVDETDDPTRQRGIASMAILPLWIGGQESGVLLLQSEIPHHFADQEKRPAGALAQQVANSVQNILLFEQIQNALANTQESEKLVRTIIDSTPDWIFIKDQQHRYRVVNKGYADALHKRPEDFIGKDDLELGFPEEMVKGNPEKGIHGFWTDDRQVMDSGEPVINPYDPAMIDGVVHIFHVYKTPLLDAEGKVWGVLGISRDVTERERAQVALARRARELSQVADISTLISSILDPGQMLQTVVNQVKDNFALYHSHIYLIDDRGDALNLVAGAGEVGRRMVAQGWQIPLDREKSLVARAARARQGVIVNDVRADPDFMPNELLPDTRAEMAVPLLLGDQVLGVLDVQSDEVNHFTEEDMSIQTALSAQVSVSLQNTRTYAQTQRQAEHEALINAISQKIQGTTTVESALQVAVRELGRALGASRTSVQLGLSKRGKIS